ncbi:hypothetical protein KAU39_04920, partial [bacterium]|nr:hypothetical protein [bacterium]
MIKKLFAVLLSCYLLICGIYSFSGANELPIIINSSIDKHKVTIADQITYTVILTYDPKKIKTPPFSPGTNLSSFEIKDYKIYKQKKKKG